jgi:hypothetical protein
LAQGDVVRTVDSLGSSRRQVASPGELTVKGFPRSLQNWFTLVVYENQVFSFVVVSLSDWDTRKKQICVRVSCPVSPLCANSGCNCHEILLTQKREYSPHDVFFLADNFTWVVYVDFVFFDDWIVSKCRRPTFSRMTRSRASGDSKERHSPQLVDRTLTPSILALQGPSLVFDNCLFFVDTFNRKIIEKTTRAARDVFKRVT